MMEEYCEKNQCKGIVPVTFAKNNENSFDAPPETSKEVSDTITAASAISSDILNDSFPYKFEQNFECNDEAVDRSNLLYNEYFQPEQPDDLHSLLMRTYFPFPKTRRTLLQWEKFKNYWDNYSFYAIWRKKFLEDHSCQEQDLWKELFVESLPHLLINLFLTFYVIGGAVAFQFIDENIRTEKFYSVIQFTFTTIATVVGVPLLFLSLTNIGQFIAEGYWIFLASLERTQFIDVPDERRLPLPIVVMLLLTHSLIGGLLFHFWIDEMPVIPAIYFSFVSITTIGYGDITPTPNNAIQTAIIILYLAIGMVIMSTFIASLYNYLRRLHYLGRSFSGAAHVEVWFGGTKMSVSELLRIVAEEFNVSPKMLCEVLHDLDVIITEATDPKIKLSIEEVQNRRQTRLSRTENREIHEYFNSGTRMVEMKDSLHPENKHVVLKSNSTKCLNRIPENERENIMQALGMFHHVVKTKSNLADKRRGSCISTKMQIVNNQSHTEPG